MTKKQELIKKLFEEKKITVDEMMVLLDNEHTVEYVPQPYPVYPQPNYPVHPPTTWPITPYMPNYPTITGSGVIPLTIGEGVVPLTFGTITPTTGQA